MISNPEVPPGAVPGAVPAAVPEALVQRSAPEELQALAVQRLAASPLGAAAVALDPEAARAFFPRVVDSLDAGGVDWADKLVGGSFDTGKKYLQACLKNGATSFDMDIKCRGISRNNRIQWEIMQMRPHGFGNNKRPADDQEYARCVCVGVDGSERQCLCLLRFNGRDDNPNRLNPKLSHTPVVCL